MWVTQISVTIFDVIEPACHQYISQQHHYDQVKMIESLFLNRYAQSVTLNGEKINDKDHEETGYGIWQG